MTDVQLKPCPFCSGPAQQAFQAESVGERKNERAAPSALVMAMIDSLIANPHFGATEPMCSWIRRQQEQLGEHYKRLGLSRQTQNVVLITIFHNIQDTCTALGIDRQFLIARREQLLRDAPQPDRSGR